MKNYPEHEKLIKIEKESQAIGEFYHWAVNKGYLGTFKHWKRLEDILAEFFDIDLQKIDKEKKQMLEELRRNKIK